MTLLESLKWRYATKSFDPSKKISPENLQTLIESARLAPTSYGIPSVRLVHVTDPAIRAQLRVASWDQSQVTDASDLFVFAVPSNFTEDDANEFLTLMAQTRNISVESLDGYKKMIMSTPMITQGGEVLVTWFQKQAYIALGFMMLAAAEMQIDSCPMEGLDFAKYDEILGFEKLGLRTAVVLPVGYRSETDEHSKRAKVRLPAERFVITK